MEFNFVYPDNHDKSTPPGGNDGALDKKIAEYNSKYAIVLTGVAHKIDCPPPPAPHRPLPPWPANPTNPDAWHAVIAAGCHAHRPASGRSRFRLCAF